MRPQQGAGPLRPQVLDQAEGDEAEGDPDQASGWF
jgi:hypothetical protein